MSASASSCGHDVAQTFAALCRYCCKSPQLPGANFPVVKKSDRRPLIRVPSIALPRSSAWLSSGDEVPHIFTRKSRLKPGKFLITSAKKTFATKSARLGREPIQRHVRSWRCVKKTRKRHAVREMKVGPSESPCRGRLQTAISCFGQKPRW